MQALFSALIAIFIFAGVVVWSVRAPKRRDSAITGPIPPRPPPSDVEESQDEIEPVPATFEAAVMAVKAHLRTQPLEARCDGFWLHHVYGMRLRNAWGLWVGRESSPLVTELNKLGLFHADDMSGLIIDCALRDMAGEPRRIDEDIRRYRDHWTRNGVDPDTGNEIGAAS